MHFEQTLIEMVPIQLLKIPRSGPSEVVQHLFSPPENLNHNGVFLQMKANYFKCIELLLSVKTSVYQRKSPFLSVSLEGDVVTLYKNDYERSVEKKNSKKNTGRGV